VPKFSALHTLFVSEIAYIFHMSSLVASFATFHEEFGFLVAFRGRRLCFTSGSSPLRKFFCSSRRAFKGSSTMLTSASCNLFLTCRDSARLNSAYCLIRVVTSDFQPSTQLHIILFCFTIIYFYCIIIMLLYIVFLC
jgi:hypothetical protein